MKIANKIDLAAYQAQIELDDSGLQQGLNSADKAVKGKAGGIASFLKKSLLGATAAIGAAGGAMFALTNRVTEQADAIAKHSAKMGISTDAYQEMNYWASQNGISTEGMERAVGRLNQRMGMAAQGSDKYAGALESLGVNMDDVRSGSLSTEEAMSTVIQSLSQMENEQQRSAAAAELFGTKMARDLMPVLADGALSIEEAAQKAHELGIVMDEEGIRAAEQYQDTLDDLQRTLGAVWQKIGIKLIPVFQQLMDWVMDHMPQIQAIFSTVFGVLETLFSGFVQIIQTVIAWVGTWFEENDETVSDIRETFESLFENLTEFFTAFVEWAQRFWDEYGENIMAITSTVFDFITDYISTAFDVIKGILNFFTAMFQGDWEGMGEALKSIASTVWDFIKNTFESALSLIGDILKLAGKTIKNLGTLLMEGLWEAIKAVWDSITGWFGDRFDSLFSWFGGLAGDFKSAGKDMLQSVWDGLKDVWGNLRTWLSDTVATIRDRLMFWRSSSNEMASGSGTQSPNIPAYRQGTPFVPNDQVALLHRGEMVVPAEYNPNNPANRSGNKGNESSDSGDTYNLNLHIGSLNGTKKDAENLFTTLQNGLKRMGAK